MSEGDKERAIVAEAIAKAWRDEAYKNALLGDATATLARAGLKAPAGLSFKAIADTPTRKHLAVPEADKLGKFQDAFVAALTKCLPLGQDQTLTLLQNTKHIRYVVIPLIPAGSMSEAELASVAGGSTATVNATVGVNVNTGVDATTTATAVAVGEVVVAT